MATALQDVCNLFQRYGWTYQELDQNALVTRFQGKSHAFILGARLLNGWLTITIPDYLPPVPAEREAVVDHFLLRANSQLRLARFAREPNNRVTLIADVASHDKLSYEAFAMALDVLSYYADDAYPHLFKLVTGTEFSPCQEHQHE